MDEPDRRKRSLATVNGPTSLYRYFDVDGRLLYVGITSASTLRMLHHAHGSAWWTKVRSASFKHYRTRDQALAVERKAVVAEEPLYNRAFTPQRSLARLTTRLHRVEPSLDPSDRVRWKRWVLARESVVLSIKELRQAGWPNLEGRG